MTYQNQPNNNNETGTKWSTSNWSSETKIYSLPDKEFEMIISMKLSELEDNTDRPLNEIS
jgi:hypothetical protein